MTDYDLILGLKTKPCVNGITPETIPTIEGSIEDMNTTLEELGTTVEGVADDVGDNTTAIGGLDTRVTAIENQLANDDWVLYTGIARNLFEVGGDGSIIPHQDFICKLIYNGQTVMNTTFMFHKGVNQSKYLGRSETKTEITSSSTTYLEYVSEFRFSTGQVYYTNNLKTYTKDNNIWNLTTIASYTGTLTMATTESTNVGMYCYVKGNNESE